MSLSGHRKHSVFTLSKKGRYWKTLSKGLMWSTYFVLMESLWLQGAQTEQENHLRGYCKNPGERRRLPRPVSGNEGGKGKSSKFRLIATVETDDGIYWRLREREPRKTQDFRDDQPEAWDVHSMRWRKAQEAFVETPGATLDMLSLRCLLAIHLEIPSKL